VGDILVSVDGQPADNLPTVSYNFRLRDSTENVQLVVLRGGAEQKVSVAPVEDRSELDSMSASADPQKSLVLESIRKAKSIAPLPPRRTQRSHGVIVVACAAGGVSDAPFNRDVIRSEQQADVNAPGAER
jgi:hypothetical protein